MIVILTNIVTRKNMDKRRVINMPVGQQPIIMLLVTLG